jgi:hypothetical protein
MLQPRHDSPLGAGNAEPARALIRVSPQQASYIIENKGKFSAGIARAHDFPALLGLHKIS